LFDSVEERHQDEVHAAEEEARKRIAEANPGVDAEMLKINFSEKVKQDDDRRKAGNPGPRQIPVAARMPQPAEQQPLAQVYQNMGRFGV
jgi:TRIAD3 protein (E3 ubiquitin-protein ligase RNF216)